MSHTQSDPAENVQAPTDQDAGLSHTEPDDIGVGLLSVLFAFVAVVVLLVVVLLQAWFYNWKVELLAQRSGPINAQASPTAITKEQIQRIETYGWADPKKHTRAIPINRAMELVARELAVDSTAPAAKNQQTGGK
jgi:hypothetical protein